MPDYLKDVPFIEAADLRDYFAVHAMNALLQDVDWLKGDEPKTAAGAYAVADAMLAERAKRAKG